MVIVNDWCGQTFPHARGRLPVLGDVLGIEPKRPFQGILKKSTGLGPIFEFRAFNTKFVFATTGELAREVLDDERFEKALPPAIAALKQFAGDGLFTAENGTESWALAHELLMPAFSRSAMKTYHPVMLEATQELFSYWDAWSGPHDISEDMTKLTMEVISRSAFSHDFGSFTEAKTHAFVKAMVAILRLSQRRAAYASMPMGSRVVAHFEKQVVPHLAYVEKLLDELISERRRDNPTSEHDLLGIMLNAKSERGVGLDDVNIRHQILTFLVAGHETTSGALAFALYYLSRNPAALSQAQEETDLILGSDPNSEPTFEQVPRFRYLRRVLDESLRLWPTVPGFGRKPRATVTLSTGAVMRPEDWIIVMLHRIHRDPAVWGADAEEWDPDRFLPQRAHGRLPHSYKPFGSGERACIGRQFALHEAILVLARVLHRYDIAGDPAYDLVVSERLTLQPEGFELALTRRTPAANVVGRVGLEPTTQGL